MRKKNYETIAAALRDARDEVFRIEDERAKAAKTEKQAAIEQVHAQTMMAGIRLCAQSIIVAMSRENPGFDPDRFIEAAGLNY